MAVTALSGTQDGYAGLKIMATFDFSSRDERNIQGCRADASSCAEWLGICAAENAGVSLSHLFQNIPDDLVECLHGCVALAHFLHPAVTL